MLVQRNGDDKLNIKTFKTKDEYIKVLQSELKSLFKKMGYEQETYTRWLDTVTRIASDNNEIISCLCERLMQGGVLLCPYKFGEMKTPQNFNVHVKDSEVDGLLSISDKELNGYSGATYFERFLEGFSVAKEKFG